ncbi:MAG: AAA family ATPase [Candidatus Woesearchaeota archaeon]
MPERLSPEQWHQIEQKVGEAEKAKRKSQRASRELYEETGMTKTEREKIDKEAVLEKAKRKRVAEKALEREEVFEREAEEILGEEESPERAFVALQKKNLVAALRENRKLEIQREKLLKEESEILSGIEGEPSGSELEALEEVRSALKETEDKKQELFKSSPEAYFGLHLKQLKEYKRDLERIGNTDFVKRKELEEDERDLQKGRIVETNFVKRHIEDILTHLRASKPVMIYGHLGSGKTELAMHIARNYIGKEALVISGSKHTSLAELYGHQMLAIDKINREELDNFVREVEQKFNAWIKENQQASEAEKNLAHDRILQTYLTQFKGGTFSGFFMGPVYRAMEEGRPIIIDEVNAIPHEVLISLNHILTRRVGEPVNVQQDTGRTVEIKEGFYILMTGNLNQGQERYIDRQDMDPAFLSRLYKIEYDYLPQKTEGSLEDEAGAENEQFHLLLAKIMDKNGNIEAPRDSIRKLWNLAKAARVTQNVFAGKEIESAYYFQEAGGRPVRYLLKESVLSIRALDNILTQWQKDGYKYELDYYIWKEFISQSTIASDRAYLYQLFKDRFGFFQSEGWEQNPNYGMGGVVNVFDIKPPQNPSAPKEFFGPRDTVEFAFGKAPERAQWPEVEGRLPEESAETRFLEELEKLRDFSTTFDKDLKELAKEIEDFCKFEGE